MAAVREFLIRLLISAIRTIFMLHHVPESLEETLMMLGEDMMFLVFVSTHKPPSH
jgi:hypothetical protein